MIVAVQKGMENMAQQLRGMDFEVVTLGEYAHPVEAIVYTDQSAGITAVADANIPSDAPSGRHGVLMLNANGKNAAHIAEILRRRTYTPFF